MERGANDSGFFQLIDANGNPIGNPLAFVKEDSQFQVLEPGDKGLKIANQTAGRSPPIRRWPRCWANHIGCGKRSKSI